MSRSASVIDAINNELKTLQKTLRVFPHSHIALIYSLRNQLTVNLHVRYLRVDLPLYANNYGMSAENREKAQFIDSINCNFLDSV